jgi:hypothetical protein
MKEIICRLLVVAIIFCSGVLLPLISWGSLGRLINPFWEIIYGIGFFLGGFLPAGIRSPLVAVFGALIWPAGVSMTVYFLTAVIWRSGSLKFKMIALIFTFLSLVCIITLDKARQAPFDRFPFFTHFYSAMY